MKNNGFSLVELSIVLVILGLLTGGILTGQTLIRASELRAVTAEYQNYQTATQTFRDKYFAVPGDMRNATDFWQSAASGATCATATGTGTCNGNGDGNILAWTESVEYLRFWDHLAEAGLIEGSYTGVQVPTINWVPGENVPRSKIGNALWFVYTDVANFSGDNRFFDTSSPHGSRFGIFVREGSNNRSPFIPEEAWNIDTKLDDGKPGLGSVRSTWGTAFTGGTESCTLATASSDTDADYRLQSEERNCVLFFIRQF